MKNNNIKLKIILTLIIFLAAFLLPKISLAATYYVRTDGNDSNCSGLFNAADPGSGAIPRVCAFRTVQKGIDMATSPGDTINISGDHSNEWLPRTKADGCSGTGCANNPTYITIQTTPGTGQRAIISPGIQINHSYIIVQNLDIIGSLGWGSGLCGVTLGFSGPANYNIIRNNHIYNPANSISSCAILFGSDSHHNIAENNLIEGDTNPLITGGHHIGESSVVLTDSYQTWAVNQWQGRRIWKFTGPPWDGVNAGTVVSNDSHSIITSNGIVWYNKDCYGIGSSFGLPVIFSGTDNIFRNNIIRNLINSERVFDGLADNTLIEGNEVYNLIDSNENRPDYTDNCAAHTDLFQVVFNRSVNVTIKNNYFHDLQSQTGMIDKGSEPVSDWKIINNVFANITHRNTIGGPGFKFFNNTFFNVASSPRTFPLDGWSLGEEYKNNIIIGGAMEPNYGMISGLIGSWQECAKNVITKTWQPNTDISFWIGQGGTKPILTANGSVYIGTGIGSTGSSSPNWNSCSKINDVCIDNGITWTNTDWNTTCIVTGTKDVLFGNQWGYNRRNSVTSSFTCSPEAVDGGDPRIYDAEGTKRCLIKDSSEIPASNNYYGIWDPPTYSARRQSIIDNWIGDRNYINGGNPKFVAAFTNCIKNTCDFHLQSDSPLIGAGIALDLVTTDKDGLIRQNPPTIGAYEYVSTADTTPPAAPRNLRVE